MSSPHKRYSMSIRDMIKTQLKYCIINLLASPYCVLLAILMASSSVSNLQP